MITNFHWDFETNNNNAHIFEPKTLVKKKFRNKTLMKKAKEPNIHKPCTLMRGLFWRSLPADADALSAGSRGRANLPWSIPSVIITQTSARLSNANSWSAHVMHLSEYWSERCCRYCKVEASLISRDGALAIDCFSWKQTSHCVNLRIMIESGHQKKTNTYIIHSSMTLVLDHWKDPLRFLPSFPLARKSYRCNSSFIKSVIKSTNSTMWERKLPHHKTGRSVLGAAWLHAPLPKLQHICPLLFVDGQECAVPQAANRYVVQVSQLWFHHSQKIALPQWQVLWTSLTTLPATMSNITTSRWCQVATQPQLPIVGGWIDNADTGQTPCQVQGIWWLVFPQITTYSKPPPFQVDPTKT